ncbi:hypothetical protein SAY87_008927 [Trapa incisa]|nr:hypothetical protein SAY87_008927 [Trapa incisa]
MPSPGMNQRPSPTVSDYTETLKRMHYIIHGSQVRKLLASATSVEQSGCSRRLLLAGDYTMATARTVKDVSPHEFVKAYAAHLKRSGKVELPHWTDIVKTATFKELAPYDPDWYYIRAASMARKIYLRGGLGVGAFRRIYGGSKRNGSRPPHFCKSSGSIARHILQQLQNMNIIDIDPRG